MRHAPEPIDTDTRLAMRSIIERIATGPEQSQDISQAEAHLGTRAILDNRVDPVQAGIFLTLPTAPFLPALLAECGLCVVTHGLEAVGSKYGVAQRVR
jgi:anthranilate phosphoribosyltransferase